MSAVRPYARRTAGLAPREVRLSRAYATREDRRPDGQDKSTTGRASDALFRLAEEEERQAASDPSQNSAAARLHTLVANASEKPWTGDESTRDAVLRMLIDKYPPLRDKDHKKEVQQPTPRVLDEDLEEGRLIRTSSTVEPAEPVKPKNPWDYEFKAASSWQEAPVRPIHKTIIPPKAERSRSARFTRLKDAVADYSLGEYATAKAKAAAAPVNRTSGSVIPIDPKAFTNFIEEKISTGRRDGLFKANKYRGKPLQQDINQSNPFIDNTDFLMNRIMQRQSAAPPFVTLQQELEGELQAFRTLLQDSWTRRALRMLSLLPLQALDFDRIGDFRDTDWEARERAYHDASITQINSILRRYNALAPFSARRPLVMLKYELAACFTKTAPLIRAELERRKRDGMGTFVPRSPDEISSGSRNDLEEKKAEVESLWRAFTRSLRELVSRQPTT
ncbi:uncharacterized protein L969DRAFT_14477 [Mixia osmundae IAM 14324]|uniref:DnaJ homologue subfamily C member 28 conserved domain-containing protein n=1 Tax=Mixia osmundae (strain CBS 9802 / IAM 14324 / JCM 22182 / KY 12970) TaxID=764103 RepID=G7E0C2_MIXOS|nr:uncharacterized protein L969DRAFT_14477 [Mixia osmundae IAM 14324]KEI42274.1 hypothetical protein L969DRAFT_14477 [Mixia osmundae IAM 14324]GAA96282.1 hypothetical protein E5Q_02948 [Mixia osmundae IAM 14324]